MSEHNYESIFRTYSKGKCAYYIRLKTVRLVTDFYVFTVVMLILFLSCYTTWLWAMLLHLQDPSV